MSSTPLIIVSAVVLIDESNNILLAERPKGKALAGMWEFPGGKLENGETAEDALIRELKEELDITIEQKHLTPLTFASHKYETMNLLMPVFTCPKWAGKIIPKEEQRIKWVKPKELNQYDMPPADIPLIPIIQKQLAS